MKHTPGPWYFHSTKRQQYNHFGLITVTERLPKNLDAMDIVAKVYSSRVDQLEEDVQLIVAAPAMAKLLSDMVEKLEKFGSHFGDNSIYHRAKIILESLK